MPSCFRAVCSVPYSSWPFVFVSAVADWNCTNIVIVSYLVCLCGVVKNICVNFAFGRNVREAPSVGNKQVI